MANKEIISLCKKVGITDDQFLGKEKIDGYLYLGSVTTLPDGFNPTVGGDLDLRSVTTLPDGFNPTVGGDLYLRSGRRYIGTPIEPLTAFFWKVYALIDNIFCRIEGDQSRNIDGVNYTIRAGRRIARKETLTIVSQGNLHAHGKTFKEAFADLQFKIVSKRLKNEPITSDTLITVMHYRAITGACRFGCKSFMDRHKIAYTQEGEQVIEKEPIRADALLKLLKKDNAYGTDRFEKLMQ